MFMDRKTELIHGSDTELIWWSQNRRLCMPNQRPPFYRSGSSSFKDTLELHQTSELTKKAKSGFMHH